MNFFGGVTFQEVLLFADSSDYSTIHRTQDCQEDSDIGGMDFILVPEGGIYNFSLFPAFQKQNHRRVKLCKFLVIFPFQSTLTGDP